MSSPGYRRWKDLAESEMPEELQMGPSFMQKKAFVPDSGPIDYATTHPPIHPSMLQSEGSTIKWTNVANILIIAGIVIFLLSLSM
jgi:hypothetical protein